MNTDYRNIYENCFKNESYNKHDDKEVRFEYVKEFILKNKCNKIIDVGSGRGNLINIIKNKINHPCQITSTDIKKFHNHEVTFFEIDLSQKDFFKSIENEKFDLLTCLDVLEHIEKKHIDNILQTFKNTSFYCILTIANHSDILNGVELHLIQENELYWNQHIDKYFEIIGLSKHFNERLYIYILKSKNE